MTQYFSDILHQPTSALDVPDLQMMAKDNNINATLIMCRLTIAIAVQCEMNKEIIAKIQSLTEAEQHSLMRAIEQVRTASPCAFSLIVTDRKVMAKVKSSGNGGLGEGSMTE